MTRRRGTARVSAAVLAIALTVVMLAAPGCRRGQAPPTTRPRPVTPYPSYFQSRLGDEIYLFATLDQKAAFHTASAEELPFDLFISRTGQRVFICSADPVLVPRIQVAYEQALGTQLAAFDPVQTPTTEPVVPLDASSSDQ